jgi:hypothetical protein
MLAKLLYKTFHSPNQSLVISQRWEDIKGPQGPFLLTKYPMIYTLAKHELTSLQPLLLDFFQTDILHLTFRELDGISHESWKTLKEKISNYIIENNIKLILVDRTGDPCLLNNKDEGYAPNNLTIQQELNKICRCLIITDDFTYYYKPNKNIIFFPYNLWLQSTKNIHKYYSFKDTVYDTTIEKTRAIMCLNRNSEWHRLYLFSLLASKSWFNLIDYSFITLLGDRLNNEHNIKKYLTDVEISVIRSYEYLLPVRLDYEQNIHISKIPIMYSSGASSVNNPVYSRNAINLVTETTLVNGIALTEKTAKAIMAYQIPILVAPVGSSQFLEDIGIDMFSDYIPWKSWDFIEDNKLRINLILEFLDSILSSSTATQNIIAIHQIFHPRLIKNKEYFHSKKFENILLAQIKS